MIFVTGGTGLVGSHILLKLSEKGFQCKALKRKNSDMKVCQSIFNHYNWYNQNLKDQKTSNVHFNIAYKDLIKISADL